MSLSLDFKIIHLSIFHHSIINSVRDTLSILFYPKSFTCILDWLHDLNKTMWLWQPFCFFKMRQKLIFGKAKKKHFFFR